MKIIMYLFIVILFLLLGLAVMGGIWVKDNTSLRISDFFGKEGEVEISEKARDEIEDNVRKLDGKIYEEATEHNPEGDMLPDEIDDTIREKLKEEIKKELEDQIDKKIEEQKQ